MARRRRVVREVGGVPPELADPDHPIWRDLDAVEQLAGALGLEYREPAPSAMRDPFFERFKAFRRAWADANGMMNAYGKPDYRALREAGVCGIGGRSPRYRMLPDGSVVPLRP